MKNAGLAGRLQEVGRPIVVATHPRSGTHLTIDLLRKQFEACKGWLWPGETLHHLYLNMDRLSPESTHPVSMREAIEIVRRPRRPTLKTHSLPSFHTYDEPERQLAKHFTRTGHLLCVVRDGRDVLCSAYAWRHSQQRSLSAFLRESVDGRNRVRYWAEHVRRWADRSDAHILRFESILQKARSVVERLGDILGLPPLYEEPYLPEPMESDSRLEDYWRRLTRNYESTTIVGRRNGKTPPDWKTDFTGDDRRFFWEEAGPALEELEYETDDSWVAEPV